MNQYPSTHTTDYAAQVDDCVRENPTRSLLIAAGIGLAIGVAVRAMQPRSTSSRASRLLEDLQDRLHELSDRASSLANNGSGLVADGVDRVRDLRLDRKLNSLSRRVRSLFN
jgi:ElaB/YqjD/DUF883 family membrane-anchored ribosome-binding protein